MTEFKVPTDGVVVCLESRVQGPHICDQSADAYLHLPSLCLPHFPGFVFFLLPEIEIMPLVLTDITSYYH